MLETVLEHIQQTKNISKESSCKRLQVGCIIVNENNDIVGEGRSGYYGSGGCNAEAGHDLCGCLHAETLALINLTTHAEGESDAYYHFNTVLTLYCTDSPCLTCAHMIVAQGYIKHVVYTRECRKKEGLVMLHENNISAFFIGENNGVT